MFLCDSFIILLEWLYSVWSGGNRNLFWSGEEEEKEKEKPPGCRLTWPTLCLCPWPSPAFLPCSPVPSCGFLPPIPLPFACLVSREGREVVVCVWHLCLGLYSLTPFLPCCSKQWPLYNGSEYIKHILHPNIYICLVWVLILLSHALWFKSKVDKWTGRDRLAPGQWRAWRVAAEERLSLHPHRKNHISTYQANRTIPGGVACAAAWVTACAFSRALRHSRAALPAARLHAFTFGRATLHTHTR